MNDRVCVHGAVGSIGSSCVEIISGRNHLILDYGKPLEGEASVPFEFPNNPKFRKNYKVFISHSHADHAGYITEIPEDVEVYMHEMTYKALMLQNSDYGKRVYSTVHGYEIIRWNGINIMFIPVNHSAPDACGILIATKSQTLLYTGDFRLHGSFLSRYSDIVKAYLIERDFARDKFNVITEATNVGSKYSEQNIEISEPDIIEKGLLAEFKKPGLIVVKMANQNIERLKTIYDACIKTDRILVTEPYTALCAKELSGFVEACPLLIHRTASHPYNMFPDGEKWKVFCIQTKKTEGLAKSEQLYQFGGNIKIKKDEISDYSERIVMVANTQSQDYLRRKKLINRIIWSMWDGYSEYEKLCKNYDVKHIHVSGHIYENHLHFFIEELKPDNTIVVHTEHTKETEALLKDLTKVILPETDVAYCLN